MSVFSVHTAVVNMMQVLCKFDIFMQRKNLVSDLYDYTEHYGWLMALKEVEDEASGV